MKNKNVAAVFGLLLGGFGVHWFYLGRTGLGILHAVFFWTPFAWISGLISAIVWFSMDEASFAQKYSDERERPDFRRRDTDFERRRKRQFPPQKRRRQKRRYEQEPRKTRVSLKQNRRKAGVFIKAGKEFFKEFDLPAAIEQFDRALALDSDNAAIHFNLACSHSLNENAERSFYHLEQSVINGFSDFEKIKSHDALAYLRIQPEFNTFESNGYKTKAKTQRLEEPKKDYLLESTPHLLEQLKKLQYQRENGQLTEELFLIEKRKLFS